jgi:molybdopterin molybdotransferase
MITVDIALERVLAGLVPTAPETLPLPQTLGRVLAENATARLAHPPVDVSAMDGYAVRAADIAAVPATLDIIGESGAGHPYDGRVGPGQAVRIFTGAPMPAGADSVVMQEDTCRDGNSVAVTEPQSPHRHVRSKGGDFSVGQTLLAAGTVMGPRQIGLAAAMNLPWLPVRRRPRVAILSTGDEIVMPGEPIAAAQIVSSNGPALAALVTQHGGEPIQLGIARDSRDSLNAMIKAAAGCDLLVTSGGASVGDYDLVQDVLAENGLELNFWKIAIRPGKPLMSGMLNHVPVLGLPGNPVSAMVCAYLFLVPMLRSLLGLPAALPLQAAVLGCAVKANDGRQDYQRATLDHRPDGSVIVTPFQRQDSAVMSGLASADCLLIRPPHAPEGRPGDPATIMPLPAGF